MSGMRKKKVMEAKMKGENGAILVEEEKVLRRWKEYFEQLLNVDIREAEN